MDRVKIGKYWAQPLTAMVVTDRGPLMLTRILPGRWIIQTPGSQDKGFTPTWDGERFTHPSQDGLGTPDDELGDAVDAAAKALPDLAADVSPDN